MFNKLCKQLNAKKNGKKGFTLVELIVVLVILAILLAILVPSLTKWIDKAKEKQVLLPARTVYLAAQTTASEDYALSTPAFCGQSKITGDVAKAGTCSSSTVLNAIGQLANVDIAYTLTVHATADGNIDEFIYTDKTAKKVVTLDTTNGALVVTQYTTG